MKTIKLLILFGICSVGLLTQISCEFRDGKICDTAKSLMSNVMQKVRKMPGTKGDLPEIQREWSKVKTHMLGCEQCQYALKRRGETVREFDLRMNQEMTDAFNKNAQNAKAVIGGYIEGTIEGLTL